MTCRECAEFLADYLNGELPAGVRATFERHLTRCPNCETYLEQYRTVIEASRAAFDDRKGTDHLELPDDLIRAILAARDPKV